MYSEKLKNDILKECFKDLATSFTKESAGLRALASAIARPEGILMQDKKILIVKKDSNLDIDAYYITKIDDEKPRIRVVKKLDEPYKFIVRLDDEELVLECDQYEIA